jgi:preprotein translocase subunit SecY
MNMVMVRSISSITFVSSLVLTFVSAVPNLIPKRKI